MINGLVLASWILTICTKYRLIADIGIHAIMQLCLEACDSKFGRVLIGLVQPNTLVKFVPRTNIFTRG